MLELIKFVFSDFWIFLGFLFILGIVAYAIANLRLFTFVKEDHNETYNNGSGLSDEDKQFILDSRSRSNLSKITEIHLIDDLNCSITDPKTNILYIIKDSDNKYTLATYSDTMDKIIIEAVNVDIKKFSTYKGLEKENEL